MAVYLILMVIVLALGYPLIERKPTFKKKLCYVICTFASMLLISVLRYGLGNDYYSYIYMFRQVSHSDWLAIFNLGYEPGFMLLTKLISVFTQNIDVMFAIYAVLILVPTAYAIFMHSENIWMSTMMFISLTFFYCSLSFIRQALAVSLILMAYRFVKERNHFMVMLFIFLGALFHSTVIIMMPIYLVSVLIKPTKVTLAIYGGVIGLVYLLSWTILDLAVKVLPQYSGYINLNFIQNGFRPVYIITPTIIMLVALAAHFTGYGKAYPKQSSVFTNLAIINFAIWLLSLKHFVIERFSMYPYVLMIMFIPSIVTYYRNRMVAYLAKRKGEPVPQFDTTVYEQLHGKSSAELSATDGNTASDDNKELSEKEQQQAEMLRQDDEERRRIIADILAKKNAAKGTVISENTGAVDDEEEDYENEREDFVSSDDIKDAEESYEEDYDSEDEEYDDASQSDSEGSTRKRRIFDYTPDKNYLPESYSYAAPKNKVLAFITNPIAVFSIFMAVVVLTCQWYNYFGLTVSKKGFHGVVPYRSLVPAYMQLYIGSENPDDKKQLLQSEENFLSYLYRLQESDHYSVVISSKGVSYDGFNDAVRAQLERMGLTQLANIKEGSKYIAIYENGKVVYENASRDNIEYDTELGGFKTHIESGSLNSVIKMGSKDFSVNERGLNFVVLDTNRNAVIDKVRFKSYYVMISATR